MIGSLLLGVHDDAERLVYAGHVGTGFTAATLDVLRARLKPLERSGSPFAAPVPARHARGARWTARSWSARSPIWNGLPTARCAIHHGAGCGQTKNRETC
jgi:bifunctional non-homologous end joining protein LigD